MLTDKQEKFCVEYVQLAGKFGGGSDAYKLAYNAGKMSANSISVAAARLLADPKVALRIEELTKKAATVAEKDFGITVERVAREFARIGYLDFPRRIRQMAGS